MSEHRRDDTDRTPLQQPRPSMEPTRPAALVTAALAAAAFGWLLISQFYYDLPRLPWLPALMLAALAVGEGFAAYTTKARIERRPGHPPPDPLYVARLVVLAKASSMVGAIFGGFYAAVTGWLLIERGRNAHPAQDLPAVLAGVVASALLLAAALWLESACRVPPERPDESGKPPSERTS